MNFERKVTSKSIKNVTIDYLLIRNVLNAFEKYIEKYLYLLFCSKVVLKTKLERLLIIVWSSIDLISMGCCIILMNIDEYCRMVARGMFGICAVARKIDGWNP